MCMRVSIKGRRKPLVLCNRYVGGGGDPDTLAEGAMAGDVASLTALLDEFDAAKLEITGAEIGLRVRRGLALATLVRVTGPRLVTRGTTVSLRASVRKPGGAIVTRRIRVYVPRFMPSGFRDVSLKGTEPDAAPGGGPRPRPRRAVRGRGGR